MIRTASSYNVDYVVRTIHRCGVLAATYRCICYILTHSAVHVFLEGGPDYVADRLDYGV